MTKRLILFFSSLVLLLILSAGVDRLAGFFISSHEQGLNFPRNVTRNFRTSEYAFTATTNSLGFRDREFAEKKTARTRIIALGDSFTYGWGVADNQSWPKLLEQHLRSGGVDVEIANLGKPGSSPREYADVAERAIPLLHPDVVIVGILQGDDLAQMDAAPVATSAVTQRADKPGVPRRLAGWLYPNFLRAADNQASASPNALTAEWQRAAQTLMSIFTAEEKARFDQLDAHVKNAFFAGELNPSLIYLSIHSPEYFSQTMDLKSDRVRALVPKMGEQLARIQNVARQNNADVLIISVPYGIYASSSNFKSRQRLGFNTLPEMLTTNLQDEAIRSASQIAGVKFYEYTREFRQASLQKDLFFELDGHLNAAGHNYFAEVITPLIKEAITARGSK